jgi:hypothetical protein
VGRVLDHLGVEHIAAYSPQARGRSEALAGIDTMEAATVFIRDVYMPAHNARFAVKAEQDGTAFTPAPGVDLGEILCVQEERTVGNDNCVIFKRPKLQIPESPLRAHFVKANGKVRQYHDGTHAIFEKRIPRPGKTAKEARRKCRTWAVTTTLRRAGGSATERAKRDLSSPPIKPPSASERWPASASRI